MKSKSLYQSKKNFYTDPINGKFNNIRLFTMVVSASIFFVLPWINFNARQAFLFDVEFNRFNLFGLVFWPQDFILLALFLIFCVISLFAMTVYFGRVWCGFLCPQSVWIKMGEFITRSIEGKRLRRFKLDASVFNFHKVSIKIFKHIFLLALSFLTAFTFIGFFVPIRLLFELFINLNVMSYSFFWILFFSIITYLNIFWFKEQFCFLVCPYARLQSVMFDENTLIVSYNVVRGEKRGARNKNFDYVNAGLGDCVDCKKCVNCCPTGIDIRDGLQIECISCGACIDACNSVMIKLGYKPGLIRFKAEGDKRSTGFLYSRIKLFLYCLLLVILFLAMCWIFSTRNNVYFSFAKSQYQLVNVTKDNFLENEFLFKIMNKSENDSYYKIFIEPDIFDLNKKEVFLKSGELINISITLRIKNGFYKKNFINIVFNIVDSNSGKFVKKDSKFILFDGDFNE